jgi:hypothetical protein
MAMAQEALAEVAMLLRVEHMGSDVSVESGLTCSVPHNEAVKHDLGMAMMRTVETPDDYSSVYHVPIAGEVVRWIVDGLQTCLTNHRTGRLMALLDRMPRLQLVLVYLRIE